MGEAATRSAAALAAVSGAPRHDVAVVLGSGWATVADVLGAPTWEGPLTVLPGIPAPTAHGHGGTVRSLVRGQVRVLVLIGRVLLLTNAAGGIRPGVPIGTPVLISDHLDLTTRGPDLGARPRYVGDPGRTSTGGRSPGSPPAVGTTTTGTDPGAGVYSARLRALARDADPTLPDGVYAGLVGPHFETPAEIRMLRVLGADLVGMSTVLEAAAAHAAGAEVLGVSLVSNLAAGVSAGPLSAEDVLEAGRAAQPRLGALLAALLGRLGPAFDDR